VGCGLICAAFVLVESLFLYFYFAGTPTKRGNPVMPLVAGVIFTVVGLLGAYALLPERKDR
jgi:hypothetical protein